MAILINDMALPDIPSDVLAISPYAVVLTTASGGNTIYVLAVTNSSVFHGTGSVLGLNIDEGIGSFGAGATYYTTDSTAWNALGTAAAGEFYTALGVQADGSTISLAWANHNIHELTSYDATTGEYTTGSIWYAKSVEGIGEEELVATHCYYNTVLLPVIPEDVLKTHPYGWIRTNSQTGYYDLLLSSSPWWQADSTTITTANYAEGIQWYRVLISGSDCEWNFHQKWTEGGDFSVDANRPVLWANHNIPVGSVSASAIYFHGSTPVPVLESYDIRRDTLACIANQVRRLCCTTESLTPARMKRRLEDLNIELQPAQVTSSDEEQIIYPDEGYYGFSSITVGAVQTGGGTGGGDGDDTDTNRAENNTFGNETVEDEVETGLLDYSSGTDEDAPGLPAIPEGNYQALFKIDMGESTMARVYVEGMSTVKDVRTHVPTYIYAVRGWYKLSGTAGTYQGYTKLFIVSPDYFAYEIKNASQNWSSYNASYKNGDYYVVTYTLYSIQGAESAMSGLAAARGVPFYDVGLVDDYNAAALAFVETAEPTGKYLAFVSNTQIRYDGATVNNEDGSSMFIYECDSLDTNEWVQIGTTGGGDYPVGSYTLEWNSHDMLDLSGETVTQGASDAPVPETETTTVTRPVVREESYTVSGDTMNALVIAAQQILGTSEPMTPAQAAEALEEYYAGLNAG